MSENIIKIKNNLKKETLFKVISIGLIVLLFFLSLITCSEIYIQRKTSSISPIIFIIIILIEIICIINWIILSKKNKKLYQKEVFKKITSIIPNSECQIDNFINTNDLYNIGIIPLYDTSYGNYLIKFIKDNKNYVFCNINLQLSIDSNGQKLYDTEVFKGQVYILDNNIDIKNDIRIISSLETLYKNFQNVKAQTFEEHYIKTESELFNKNFEVYSSDKHSAFYLLNSNIMEKLIELKEKYSIFNMYFSNEKIIVVINSNKTFFEENYNFYDKNNLDELIEKDINDLLQTINDFKFLCK